MSKKEQEVKVEVEVEVEQEEKTETAVVTIVCPHCQGEVPIEAPVYAVKRRGQLEGLSLESMSDEQLKREIINANSVLYKAQKRNADVNTVAKNQARADAAKAEKAKRDAAKKAAEPQPQPQPEPDAKPEEAAEM